MVLALLGCQRRAELPAMPAAHPALASLPPRMLWAWERAEDLRWLPAQVGVAYVASSILLAGPSAQVRARANPLYVAATTPLVPVVHVDASWQQPPTLSEQQQAVILAQVLRAARGYRVVQLDFEVRRSQRAFLQALVARIRQQLPADTALSITALASWCSGDYWLANIAADEIVPMTFRMGPEQEVIRQQIARDGGFRHAKCNRAIGYAQDEARAASKAPRQYYFSPKPWRAESWRQMFAS